MTNTEAQKIKELHGKGCTTKEIAAAMGWPYVKAYSSLRRLGLLVNYEDREKLYTVYDRRTSEYICEGSAIECAKRLGCANVNGFYCIVTRARKGDYKKYEIHEVEEANGTYHL